VSKAMTFFAQNLSLSGERDVLFSSLGNKKPKYQSLRPQIASVSPLVNIMRKKKKGTTYCFISRSFP